jgi:hypothetical protein
VSPLRTEQQDLPEVVPARRDCSKLGDPGEAERLGLSGTRLPRRLALRPLATVRP